MFRTSPPPLSCLLALAASPFFPLHTTCKARNGGTRPISLSLADELVTPTKKTPARTARAQSVAVTMSSGPSATAKRRGSYMNSTSSSTNKASPTSKARAPKSAPPKRKLSANVCSLPPARQLQLMPPHTHTHFAQASDICIYAYNAHTLPFRSLLAPNRHVTPKASHEPELPEGATTHCQTGGI